MAHVIFPLDSAALGTAVVSTPNFSLLLIQDGSQHEFCWPSGQVPVPHSFPVQDSQPPEGMASSDSPVLTLLPSDWSKWIAWARPTQSDPRASSVSPSLPTWDSHRDPEYCSITASPSSSLCLFYHIQEHCPSPRLTQVFSVGGNVSALQGFASPVRASGRCRLNAPIWRPRDG